MMGAPELPFFRSCPQMLYIDGTLPRLQSCLGAGRQAQLERPGTAAMKLLRLFDWGHSVDLACVFGNYEAVGGNAYL